MLNRGLITPDEYRLIMIENMVAFPTFISSIL
nr:MAG TPA: Short C-terminal domain [Caudoviricetes sp.]